MYCKQSTRNLAPIGDLRASATDRRNSLGKQIVYCIDIRACATHAQGSSSHLLLRKIPRNHLNMERGLFLGQHCLMGSQPKRSAASRSTSDLKKHGTDEMPLLRQCLP
jgi:hypothetical protein